jgi:hypothetical protein
MRIRVVRPRILTLADRRAAVKFVPGEYTVRREWGQQLVDRGDAVEMTPPPRTAVAT